MNAVENEREDVEKLARLLCEARPHVPVDLRARIDAAVLNPMAAEIIAAVAEYYGVKVEDLTGIRQYQSIARIRHVAMYACKKLTLLLLKDIGIALGGRDHTTVMHGVRAVESRAAGDPSFAAQLRVLMNELQTALGQRATRIAREIAGVER